MQTEILHRRDFAGYNQVLWLGSGIRDASNKLKAITHSNDKSLIKAPFGELFQPSHIFHFPIHGCGSEALEFKHIESTSSLSMLRRVVPASVKNQ